MSTINRTRRRLTGTAGALSALGSLASLAACANVSASTPKLGKVGVIGAGFGGATAARYLKLWGGSQIEVMLIDRNREFVSCPLSNLVLGGSKQLSQLTVGYGGLRDAGVMIVNDEVTGIDPVLRRVSFAQLAEHRFDKLIVSPGVDLLFDQVQGYDAQAQSSFLHAWKAGPQTVALRKQLEAMPDGGVYVLTVPRAPYRCPPGPYERVCQVASYFKAVKPKSKVIVLDANPEITSKKALFGKIFEEQYRGIVEYRPNSNVVELDAAGKAVTTDVGDRVQGDVINIVPPQRAADIAVKAGLVNANNRWCNIDWVSMESTAHKHIHVLGDATLSAPAMPKSGHMANQHGKAAAAAIIETMSGRAPQPQMMANTCYSFIDADNVIHVCSVHAYNAEKKTMEVVTGSGGLSQAANPAEGAYAQAWANNIWKDMLG